MTTRYFKVVDDEILNAINAHFEKRTESQKKANDFGKAHGVGDAGFRMHGMWDIHLIGFECPRSKYNSLERKELWTLPKNGYSRPKSKKGSTLYEEFQKLCRSVKIHGGDMDNIIGFNSMTFFPTSPGYRHRSKDNSFVFMMPERCNEVKGCIEITNIEYMQEAA